MGGAGGVRLRSHAKPILEEIKGKLMELSISLPPRKLFAVAIRYELNQWEELLVYTTDGKLEIDTNLVKNRIRPIARVRKNYLFVGDYDVAPHGAIIYTIIASCKVNDINPTDYLADLLNRVFTRILSNLDDLLPWNRKPLEKLFKRGRRSWYGGYLFPGFSSVFAIQIMEARFIHFTENQIHIFIICNVVFRPPKKPDKDYEKKL